MKCTVCYLLSPLIVAFLGTAKAKVTGHWDFEKPNEGYAATIGHDIIPLHSIELDTDFVQSNIGGELAQVMGFPRSTPVPRQGYRVYHGAKPSFGARVNQYTIIMDIMFPEISDFGFIALMETNSPISGVLPFDAEWFVRSDGGIGVTGRYHGHLEEHSWHRIGLALDNVGGTYDKYIDGVLVNRQTVTDPPLAIDSRFSLDGFFDLFSDNDFETAPGFLNSLQFHDRVLSRDEMAKLGGASANGIPIPVPEPAAVTIVLVGIIFSVFWRRRQKTTQQ